jgi:hypothetical protein
MLVGTTWVEKVTGIGWILVDDDFNRLQVSLAHPIWASLYMTVSYDKLCRDYICAVEKPEYGDIILEPRPHTCYFVKWDTGLPGSRVFEYCPDCDKERSVR